MNFNVISLLAKSLSFIFHPLLVPTIIFSLIAIYLPEMLLPFNSGSIVYLIIYIFITTWLLPALAILGLYLSRVVSSILLDDRKERVMILCITAFIYSLAAYVLYTKLRANEQIMVLFLSMIGCMLIAGLITLFWKISLHSTAATSSIILIGFIASKNDLNIMLFPLLFGIILTGSVLSARLYLNKHTILQVAAGAALGAFISVIAALYNQISL